MMMTLLVIKSKLTDYYEKHYKILRGLLKFLIAFLVFFLYTKKFSYSSSLDNMWLMIGLAALCAFLPDVTIVCIAVILVLIEISKISIVLAGSFFALLCIYFLLFGRYTKQQSYIVLAYPLLFILKVPYVMPIVGAIFTSPAMLPAMLFGALVQYVLLGIENYNLVANTSSGNVNSMEAFRYVVDYVLNSQELLIIMIAIIASYLVTYFVRKTKINYASQIAILVGTMMILVVLQVGSLFVKTDASVLVVIIGVLVSMLIAYGIQFFRMSLDYKGTRSLQFEDDEYYYYVKAVPKMKVTVEERQVTRIRVDEVDEETLDLHEEFAKAMDEENRN